MSFAACMPPYTTGGSTPPREPTPQRPGYEVSADIIRLTNSERLEAGLPPLSEDTRLNEAARLHADQMARTGRIDHVLPGAEYPRPEDRFAAAGYSWTRLAENLAHGQLSPGATVRDWMDSSGHRGNILNADFTETGAAYAADVAGRSFYVQVFARPR